MKLLIVSHFYEVHGGGIERVAAQLCRELARAGHEVIWAAGDADAPPGDIITTPLRCIDLAEGLTGLPMPLPMPRAIRALARAVCASDAVVVHDALYITSILALLLAKAQGKPCLMIQHIAGIAFANRVLRCVMACANFVVTRPMLAVADHLVFISDTVRRELIGEPARHDFRLLFNGVDPTVFHPADENGGTATRAAFGLPSEGALAVFVGRFVEKKGLAALRALAVRRPSLHLAMVGAGPIRPERWGLANVHVLGALPQARVAALYRAADLLLLPSVGEGFPLVVQEAMASGLPVVCGYASSRADPEATAFLRGVAIDLADPEGSAMRCAAAIDNLTADPVDRARMAAYAAASYSWPAMAAGIAGSLSGSELLDAAAGRQKRR